MWIGNIMTLVLTGQKLGLTIICNLCWNQHFGPLVSFLGGSFVVVARVPRCVSSVSYLEGRLHVAILTLVFVSQEAVARH